MIDTHILIWTLTEPEKLPPNVRRAIEDSENEIYVSAAVGWEIGMKYALGKLPMPIAPGTYLPARLAHYGFRELPVTMEHALGAASLPAHHHDPFDRMLVSQAQLEAMTLVSIDPAMRAYAVDVLYT